MTRFLEFLFENRAEVVVVIATVALLLYILYVNWHRLWQSRPAPVPAPATNQPADSQPAATHLPPGDPGHYGLTEPDVPTHRSYYWLAMVLSAVVFSVFAGMLWGVPLPLPWGEGALNAGILAGIAGILYFAAGFRVVDANRIGGIFVLGKPAVNNISGTFYIVPPGICWLLDEEILTQEMEIPAEPHNIWREKTTPPADRPHVRPPIRITFAEGDNMEDPLQRRVTEEVSFFVRLRVNNFFNFYVRLGSMKEAKNQLEDIGVSILAEELPKVTLSEAIRNLETYTLKLSTEIADSVKRSTWGVRIVTARIKQFSLSASLNEKIQTMAESTAEKRAAIAKAQGEREKRKLEGEGTALAIQAELDARTDGMKRMAEQLGAHGRDVLGVEAARTIGQAPSSKTIVGLDGYRQLAGVGAAIAAAINPPEPPQPQPPAQGDEQ